MHAHLPIRFADGTFWLARILRDNLTSFSSQKLSNEILTSECATLKWLETPGVPAPRLHCYGLRNDPTNKAGVAFMLVDQLPGQLLDQYNATNDQKQRAYAQLGAILSLLSQHPLGRIESFILDEHGSVCIGPVMGDRTGTLSRLGPFDDATSYYTGWPDESLRLIAGGQLFSHFLPAA
ncbi:hypothetical protein VTI74DRAFT_8114 [Chaetomium olivicolor]